MRRIGHSDGRPIGKPDKPKPEKPKPEHGPSIDTRLDDDAHELLRAALVQVTDDMRRSIADREGIRSHLGRLATRIADIERRLDSAGL